MNMEIIFKDESSKLFGSTKMIGIGRRQPKLIYGSQARNLREQAHLTVEQLSNELNLKESVIKKLENQKISLDEKLFNKYADKFNVTKEYFFDLDLDTLILTGEGHIIKSFKTGKDYQKYFDEIMDEYFNAIENKDKYIVVDLQFLN